MMNPMNPTQAKATAYQEAVNYAEPLDMLIHPSDVSDDANEWDDIDDETMRQEIAYSADVVMSENQLDGVTRELAIVLWASDMPRASMADLAFDSQQEAVENGYWPHKMGWDELSGLLWEMDIPTTAYQEASAVVTRGYCDGTNPRIEPEY